MYRRCVTLPRYSLLLSARPAIEFDAHTGGNSTSRGARCLHSLIWLWDRNSQRPELENAIRKHMFSTFCRLEAHAVHVKNDTTQIVACDSHHENHRTQFVDPFFTPPGAWERLPSIDHQDVMEELATEDVTTDTSNKCEDVLLDQRRVSKTHLVDASSFSAHKDPDEDAHQQAHEPLSSSTFRGDTDGGFERRATKLFMYHAAKHRGLTSEFLTSVLNDLTSEDVDKFLEKARKISTYAWIFLSPNVSTSIRRLVALENTPEPADLPRGSLWVALQLLRAQHIDAQSLTELLSWFMVNWKRHHWNDTSLMVFVVRMLRHARATAPSLIENITILFTDALDAFSGHSSSLGQNERLRIVAKCANSVVSLLRLPSKSHPFRLMIFQQEAQLSLLRYMQNHKPRLPMSRQAFRAVGAVQAMHRKTAEESEWSRAQSPRWPPWEDKNAMGAKLRPKEYSGKDSRAERVLQQMEESGYARQDSDLPLQIVAGKDTDRSPTIQLRRKTDHFYLRPSRETLPDSSIWAARVDSTRTVREAWMCFCNYTASIPVHAQSAHVYHVMFMKLQAHINRHSSALPGDGLETYPDPEAARDRVYIPENIPTTAELFSRMVCSGITPSLRLLGDLLHQENSFFRGMEYISHAPIDADARTILSHPQQHDHEMVAQALRHLPLHLSRPYLRLLARPNVLVGKPLPLFGKRNGRCLHGSKFAANILKELDSGNSSIWDAFLKALLMHGNAKDTELRKERLSNIWLIACNTLSQRRCSTLTTFGMAESIAKLAFLVATSPRKDGPWDIIEGNLDKNPVRTAKRTFMLAATGKFGTFATLLDNQILLEVPRGNAIEALVWSLGTAQTEASMEDTLQLLRWTHHHRVQLRKHTLLPTKHNLAAFRAFLTGLWAFEAEDLLDEVHVASTEQVQEARALVEELGGWPDDDYMLKYLRMQRGKFSRICRLLRKRVADRASPGQKVT